MRGNLLRGAAVIVALSLAAPPLTYAQTAEPTVQPGATTFNAEHLDALLAPVALYPDALLVQVLMASTFPLQVVEASRWLEEPGNKDLQGDALAQALESLNWDPSVKSLVPFPQVVATLNSQLEWMQQLGYAFATQQADVMASVQRLRHQAQAAGTLTTTQQQRVAEENGTIAIEPASPNTVYLPVYNPTVVYGVWPNQAYQPVYIPPPADYSLDSAVVGGFAFGTGVVIVGSLWGWAHPGWHRGLVHLDVDRFNRINVNRAAILSEVWRAPPPVVVGQPFRPPVGPVVLRPRPAPSPAATFVSPNVMAPGVPVRRSMVPVFRPPPVQWTRPRQPVARPPVVIERPATPQRGGFQQRFG
jgi:hypothetical protein